MSFLSGVQGAFTSLGLPTDLASAVMPSLRLSKIKENQAEDKASLNKFLEDKDNVGRVARLTISNRLDAVEYFYDESYQKTPCRDRKWVVFFPASGITYESMITDSKLMAKALQANVLMFNYRGVGEGSDYPQGAEDFVQDAKDVYYHLRYSSKHYVPMSNILSWGQSIGSAIAAQALTDPKYAEGHIVFDRSFTSLPAAAENLIPYLGKMAKFTLSRYGWIYDNVSNIENIKGCKIIANSLDDGVIGSSASLANYQGKVDLIVNLNKKEEYDGDSYDLHTKSVFHRITNVGFTNSDELINRAYKVLHPQQTEKSGHSVMNNQLHQDLFGGIDLTKLSGSQSGYHLEVNKKSEQSSKVIVIPPVIIDGERDEKQSPPPLTSDET